MSHLTFMGTNHPRHGHKIPGKIFPGYLFKKTFLGLLSLWMAWWMILALCPPALADLTSFPPSPPQNLKIVNEGGGGEWGGGDVSLAWDANSEPDLAGYMVFWGNESGSYPYYEDAGPSTSHTVIGLVVDTYYFAAKAYNTSYELSEFSNEVPLSPGEVPLPGALLLFGTGIGGLAIFRRWRRPRL